MSRFLFGFFSCALFIYAASRLIRDTSSKTANAPAVHTTTVSGRNSSATRMMRVTAYCPCVKCCGRYADGITASGKPVTYNRGRFVAAPRELPFGTVVDVPGYGVVEVIDRGGVIKGNRLDVFFPTHQEALEWGVQNLEVRIEP